MPARMPGRLVIGLDVGGTNTTGVLAAPDGTAIGRLRRPTDRPGGASAGLRLIFDITAGLLTRAAAVGSVVERIGIGFGGPVDHEAGVVRLSHQVPGWEGVALVREVEERFRVRAVLDNDANAGALGEWRFGAGRGVDDLLYVNVGTGIGGGVVAGGRLVRGARNLAGEIGHTVVVRGGPRCTCGRLGCLEACASGEALARRASAALGRPVGGPEVFTLAGAGDTVAGRVLSEVVEDLAHGIGNAVGLLDPRLVIVGGGLSEAPAALFLDPLRAAIPRYCLEGAANGLRVEAARLGYEAGVLGAVALAAADLP